jgi:hypothetical protein
MEKQNDSIRERLLARLPQPERLAAYREETAALLAKHEKALFWEKMPSTVFSFAAIAMVIFVSFWGQKLDTLHSLWLWASPLFLGMIFNLRYQIYRSNVDTLKEVKQVQLQILELQASLQKRSRGESDDL